MTDKRHNLGGAVDLRSLTQPESQFFVLDAPNGKRQAYPLVAVAFFSDAAIANITQTIVANIFSELERRGVISPQETTVEQPAQEQPDAHQPE